ncbi:MAG: HupE/UreJ family protein [Pseudomonadota bacterium]
MKYLFPFLALLFFPLSALAHEGVSGGFESGLTHPVLGLDHLLAMVAVGIISSQMGGKAIWTVPATFVIVMAIGGALGLMDIGLFAIEIGIALSVVVLGFTIATNAKLHQVVIYGFVALFAIFHGYAHGLEIPELASSWSYVVGFMIGTAGLHILGLAIGYFAKKAKKGEMLLQYSGAVIAGMGLHIILGMVGF